jgi:hypothetical protein
LGILLYSTKLTGGVRQVSEAIANCKTKVS